MKRLPCFILLLASCLTPALRAQQAEKFTDQHAAMPNFVFDDDGGSVQVVPADLATGGTKSYHRGAIMKSFRQISILLGGGWSDRGVRSREATLADLTRSGSCSLDDLTAHGIQSLPAFPPVNDFSDLSHSRVNDLTIQHKLVELLQNKAIPAPTASAIYVIYLAPEVASFLGTHTAVKDYAAYHNFFHFEASELHYVVVPHEEDVNRHRSAACRALAETALNPNGKGWY